MKKVSTILSFSRRGPLFLIVAILLLISCGGGDNLKQSNPEILELSDSELTSLADTLYDRQEHDQLVPVLDECLRRKINSGEMSFRKGVTLYALGRKAEAVQSFNQAVHHNPHHFKAHFNLGATYYELHDFERSISSYEATRNIQLPDDEAIYGIAASQFALGLYEKSRENAEAALRLNPNSENAKTLITRLNSLN